MIELIATRHFCSNVCRSFRALITGAPGSGKGTISSRIVHDFGLVHLSSGDVLRLHVKQGSTLGVKAKDYIDQGALVPDGLMVELMTSEIKQLSNKSWLLDGFPRTIEQAKQLDMKQKFDIVINLDVPFSEIKRRIEQRFVHLSSGRVYHLEWNPPKNPGVDDITGEPLIQRDDDKSQIIQRWGYPVEEYDVTTSDGYILTVQRIPRGRGDKETGTKRPVVFLQHGLLGSSSQWITNLPQQSLGYVLADKGFDVWLGNSRGNAYALKHERLSTDSDKFWDFSFDEFAKYDLPASLEFAMARSGQRRISYIGHSQGTTIGFAAFSQNQTLAAKVDLFIALAPVATVGNMKSPIKYLSYFSGGIQWLTWLLGVRDFLPSSFVTRSLGRYVCEDDLGSVWCSNVMFLLCGYDKAQLNETRLPVYVAHTPAGTSVKDVVHFAQLLQKISFFLPTSKMYKSGKFQMYDYGWRYKNRIHYGQSTPKLYDVSKMRVSVALFSGDQDWLATPKDVSLLVPKLRTKVFHKSIQKWDHLDFIWGIDAPSLIYGDIERLLKKFKRRAKILGA